MRINDQWKNGPCPAGIIFLGVLEDVDSIICSGQGMKDSSTECLIGFEE